jgi:hypothetical protein
VRQRDVAQARERKHLLDALPDLRKQSSWTGMEQERLVVVDQILVEAERHAARQIDSRGKAVDAVGDLVDTGGIRLCAFGHRAPPLMN